VNERHESADPSVVPAEEEAAWSGPSSGRRSQARSSLGVGLEPGRGAGGWHARRQRALTPSQKHGSWLNMAEIELAMPTQQCLDRRIADRATLPWCGE
jgi:hypothetical protein